MDVQYLSSPVGQAALENALGKLNNNIKLEPLPAQYMYNKKHNRNYSFNDDIANNLKILLYNPRTNHTLQIDEDSIQWP